MTGNPVSATPAGMSKERLPDVMTLRLREKSFERIDALAGENRRARWIREAVEAALDKAERIAKRKPTPDA